MLALTYPLLSATGRTNPWPDAAQQGLLEALLLPPAEAAEAWRRWYGSGALERPLDAGSTALLGLLHRRLPQLWPAAPAVLRDRLARAYHQRWCLNQLVVPTLREAHRLLAAEGIPLLVHKGLPLLELVHRDWGTRVTSDLDLVVAEDQVDTAHRRLVAAGWRTDFVPTATVRVVRHAATYQRAGFAALDLHWRPYMLDSSPAAEQALWQRARPCRLGGVPVLCPESADLFLLTCLHGRKRSTVAGVRWVADAVLLLRELGTVDWSLLQVRATAAGLDGPLREAQAYLHASWGLAPAPTTAAPAVPPLGRLLWHCRERAEALKPARPEAGLARAAGVARRAPHTLTYHLLEYWLPRHRRGLPTSPRQLWEHLDAVRGEHRRLAVDKI